jgi:metal-responsive CopG/Arc/MetJ family transcriptional regulator
MKSNKELKTERLQIVLTNSLLEKLEQKLKETGVSKCEFVRRAITDQLK